MWKSPIFTTSVLNIYCKPVDQFKASEFDSGVASICRVHRVRTLNRIKRRFLMLLQNEKAPKSSVVILFFFSSSLFLSLSSEYKIISTFK